MFNAKRHAFVQTIGWVLIYPYSPVMQEGNDKVKLSRRRCYIQLQRGWGNEHVFRIIKSPDHYQKKIFWRHHERKLKDSQCRTTHVEARYIKMRKAQQASDI